MDEKMDEEENAERGAMKPQAPSFDPDDMKKPGGIEKLMAGQKAGKPAMVFVTVLTKDRAGTDDFAAKSRAILKEANGMDATPYVIEDDKILFSITDGSQGYKLKTILLTLPEVAEFEWDQQKTPGPAKAEYDKKNPPKPEPS